MKCRWSSVVWARHTAVLVRQTTSLVNAASYHRCPTSGASGTSVTRYVTFPHQNTTPRVPHIPHPSRLGHNLIKLRHLLCSSRAVQRAFLQLMLSLGNVVMRYQLTLLCLLVSSATGCWSPSSQHEHQAHWLERGIVHEAFTIDLGFEAVDADSGGTLKPLAVVQRDGKPVTNAMVFCRWDSPAGDATESATVYATDGSPAWYAGPEFQPAALPCSLHFRIVLPDTPTAFHGEITVSQADETAPAG